MDWLRQQWRQLDKGFVVVALLCVIAVWPFLTNPDLPRETDAELHVFRLAELGRLVSGGEWYPRWSPNFYYGYGYPFYNYYAPLTYYLGLPLALLPGLGAVWAVKALFVGGLLLAGLGMYGFVRDNWGRPAGYVAATTYVYAPYIFYVDPHARGDLAEAFSFAVFPLALWALHRFSRTGRAAPWLASALLTAAVILTHNLMAMVFFGLLLAWVVWEMVWVRPVSRRARVLLPLALLGGVGLAAFFWLPVALEQNAVNLSSLIGDGSHFDFRNHFLSLRDLFAPPPLLDWGATEQPFVPSMGVAQWVLGLAGVGVVVAGRVRERREALFFVLAGIVLLGMMTPVSAPIWEAVPLLPYLQFPWRLLGAAAAMLAVLAGVAASVVWQWAVGRQERLALGGVIALVCAPMVLALPLTQVPPWPAEFGPTSREEVVRVELDGHWLGTTSTADFVPATVEVLPAPNNAVLWNFWTGEPLERLNRATIPAGATVEGGEITPLHFRYAVETEKPFLLRFFVFDFPGWQARIDGQPAAKELARPEGFIVVPVPAGEFTVELAFTETPVRRAAWAIAGLSLLLVVGVTVWLRRQAVVTEERPVVTAGAGHGPAPLNRWLVGAVAALLLLHGLLLSPAGWLHYDSANYVAQPAGEHVYANFGDQIALIGYDAPEGHIRPGERLEVTLYWQALRDLDINFQVFVHLLLPDGRTLVAQSDKLNPAGFPTERWPLDQYVRDAHTLLLPQELPAGEYLLSTGLWVQTEGWRLPLFDEAGQQIGDNFILWRLVVDE